MSLSSLRRRRLVRNSDCRRGSWPMLTVVRNSYCRRRSRSLLSVVSGWECRDVDRGGVVSEHVPLLAHVLLPDLLLEDRLEGELVLDLLHLPAQPLDVVVL